MDLLGGSLAFLIPAIAYALSASPEPGSWDTAELQGVPFILGIAHPTGFPLYVLVGYLWSHALPFGSVAFRMNAMSGVAIAVACAIGYCVARQLGASRLVALAATLWFAFTPNVWAHAARAEAQDLAVMFSTLAIYAFLRWMRNGATLWFGAAFALCGLGMAAHPNALWLLPAFLIGATLFQGRQFAKLAVLGFAAALAPLLFYAYLPLRSAYVVAHHLDPTLALPGVGGGIFWNYNDPRTWHGLVLELTGSEFQTPGYFLASLNPTHLEGAVWAFVTGLHEQYGTLATILVAAGLAVAWRRDWRSTLVITLACTTALLFSAFYPNESDVGRYRLLASWLAVPLLGALTPQARGGLQAALRAGLIIFLGVGASLTFEQQRHFFAHAPAEGGRWVIDAVRPYVPAGGTIVTGWLDATSLAYGAYVDVSLPGRIVVSDNKLRVAFYRRWAREHPIFVLVDPHNPGSLSGARDYARLDAYHELYAVEP